MKNGLMILFVGVLFTFSSCSTSDDSLTIEDELRNTYGIELANNEKWTVDEEMMEHIKNMDSEVKACSNVKTPDYSELGTKLDDNIGLLTSNCTMTGKAHDELHKWLVPFIELVSELNETSNFDEQAKLYTEIRESMDEFNTYFE